MMNDIARGLIKYLQIMMKADPRYSMPDGPEAGNDGYKLDGGDEEEEEQAAEDCDEVCPECMSRRVATLDLLTREYACLNCGHEWFVEADRGDPKEEML